jgi:tetratricopeptide (TPR) repeat protein
MRLACWQRWRAARDACDVALREDPEDPRLLAVRVWASSELGELDSDEAAARARELVARYPNAVETRLLEAAVNYRIGYPTAAVQQLLETQGKFPGEPSVRATLGSALGQLGRYREARLAYRRALEEGLELGPAHRYSALRCRRGVSALDEGGTALEALARAVRRRGLWLILAWVAAIIAGVSRHSWAFLLTAATLSVLLALAAFYHDPWPHRVVAFPLLTALAMAIALTVPPRVLLFEWLLIAMGLLYAFGILGRVGAALGRRASAASMSEGSPAGPWPAGMVQPLFPGASPRPAPAAVRREAVAYVAVLMLVAGVLLVPALRG